MADPAGPTVAKDPDSPEGGPVHEAASSQAEAPPSDPSPAVSEPVPETDLDPLAPAAVAEAADDTGTVAGASSTTEHPEADAPLEQGGAHLAEAAHLPVAEGGGAGALDTQDVVSDPDAQDLDEEEEEEDDDNDDDDEPGKPRGGLLTRQVQITPVAVLAIFLVLALFAGAYVLGQRQGKSAAPLTTTTTTAATALAMPKDFVPFEDKDTGVKLAIPKDWNQFSTKDLDRSYRLLLGVPNAKDNLRVRVNAYSAEVTKANVGDQKAVIDAIFSGEKITVISADTVDLNGLPALFYVYKFTDSTGEPGYHAHFFVFQGRKMVSLVFEAVPEARYALLAPVFDKIANSVQVAPGAPPPFLEELGGTGTTVPGATTTTAAPAPSTTPTT